MAGAQQNRSPLVVLGGRAPEMRWGSGSLQEIDHLPFVSPLTKSAATVKDTAHIPSVHRRRDRRGARRSRAGPTFVDYPLDVVFSEAEAEVPAAPERSAGKPADRSDEAAALLAKAERPAIMAGTGLYWAHGEEELRPSPRPSASPSSSTAWAAAACPPTTSSASAARAARA